MLIVGGLSLFCGLLMCYLAYLVFIARRGNEENLAVSLLLAWEGVTVITFGAPFGFPATESSAYFANIVKNLSVPFMAALPFAYLPLTSNLTGNDAQRKRGLIGLAVAFLVGLYLCLGHWNAVSGARLKEDGLSLYMYTRTVFSAYFIPLYIIVNIQLIIALAKNLSKAGIEDETLRIKTYLWGLGLRFAIVSAALAWLYLEIVLPSIHLGPANRTMVLIGFMLGEILFATLFCVAVVRKQILGIETLVKRNVARAFLGALMVFAFFLTEQFLENFVSELYGNLGGIAVAGVLLIAHRPIMDGTENLLSRFFGSSANPKEAETIYRDQFEIARQGGITGKERQMLNLTRRALKLSSSDAKRIEREFNQ
jgi:hypothetical protein